MPAVIDDFLLAQVIRDPASRPADIDQSAALVTTGYWWYRLANAVLADRPAGRLSTTFAEFTRDERLGFMTEVPNHVAVHGMASLAAVAAALIHEVRATGVRLNALSAEALAVAVATDAELVLATHNPPLAAGAARLGVAYRVAR